MKKMRTGFKKASERWEGRP